MSSLPQPHAYDRSLKPSITICVSSFIGVRTLWSSSDSLTPPPLQSSREESRVALERVLSQRRPAGETRRPEYEEVTGFRGDASLHSEY